MSARVLFLSQRVPYPPDRGDRIATWHLVERLARRHRVTVFAFREEEADEERADGLRQRGVEVRLFRLQRWRARARALRHLLTARPLTLALLASTELQEELDSCAGRMDVVYAYSGCMGAFVMHHPELPRILHLSELDSDKWRQFAVRHPLPMKWIYRHEARTLLRFEREVARACDETVLCTPVEQQLFEKRIPAVRSTVIRNGVDLEVFHPGLRSPDPGLLVFTGVMNYFPNVDGCVFFAREVLPLIRSRHPRTRFAIVGSRPARRIRALAGLPGVEVTGYVEDVRAYLGRAAVAVAPLRLARGVQNKVLEALAMGIPVVATPWAAQGIEGRPGHDYLVSDGAEELALEVCRILEDRELARQLARSGRRLVEDRYSWERTLAPLERLVERLAAIEAGTRAPAERSGLGQRNVTD